jgi:glycogen debranching enzyme
VTAARGVPLDLSRVPEPVLDAAPEFLELYRVAWELAWDHVVERDGVPRSPCLDEGFDPETVWIWDTCFMVHFAKYAPDLFPGVESLENFYRPMYDGEPTSLRIQHPDNPPLFAWSELEYVRHTGDLQRVRWLLDAGYLQQHFAFFDTVPPGSVYDWSRIPTTVERVERGYRWNGVGSGMDNTPRAPHQAVGGTDGDILWFDAAAQQALAARSIAGLARLVGNDALAVEYLSHHARLTALVEDFWDDDARLYCDRVGSPPHTSTGVRTPAAYWPLLAGCSTTEQADALAGALVDPSCFGGTVPWASVARDDPTFRATGHYWRGGVWVPTAYVSARALADHGHPELAREATTALLQHMSRTYREYTPASIWECYAPVAPAPATAKDDVETARPDFCGWSALAPIAMLVEHVLGFRVDAPAATVHWRTLGPGRHGIRRLRCGAATLTAVRDGDHLLLEADAPLTVVVDGVAHLVGGADRACPT